MGKSTFSIGSRSYGGDMDALLFEMDVRPDPMRFATTLDAAYMRLSLYARQDAIPQAFKAAKRDFLAHIEAELDKDFANFMVLFRT